ncbi:hypothetical protein F4859DRAFT_516472 [Xylaria cf. heliscus]|nr:hypothetical protein F4859DRAFT_516472 [Xylaria cf. heliscus]
MSKKEDIAQQNSTAPLDDDEPDEWYESKLYAHMLKKLTCACIYRDKRIFSTGCADENANLTDCYWRKKDWRACTKEMEIFRACWKKNNNDERTSTKDNTDEK